jgi:hypothetical protein
MKIKSIGFPLDVQLVADRSTAAQVLLEFRREIDICGE